MCRCRPQGESREKKISVKRGNSVDPLAAPGHNLLADPRREPGGTVGEGSCQGRGFGRYLEAVVIGPGVILRRDGDDLLPVITLRGDGTEIRQQPRK